MREQILDHWLSKVLQTNHFTRLPLAGDASFRRYYRVQVNEQRYVVMDAPPPEAPQIFRDIALVLQGQGISVPSVMAYEFTEGFLLLSDFGDRLYLSELTEQTADRLYHDAFQVLLKMQQCQAELPVFDGAFLSRQFGIFQEWFLGKHKGISDPQSSHTILKPIYDKLSETIALQPQVFVHRDYHSRNLMIIEEGNPGVLDFQDAMIGPITYDLVSLLQDCYITWPRHRVVQWTKDFQWQAQEKGLLSGQESEAEFLRWLDWTGLQRHLKNLGIFSRLYYRDGKSQYLKDIPRVLHYIKETSLRYSELTSLWRFFESLGVAEVMEA